MSLKVLTFNIFGKDCKQFEQFNIPPTHIPDIIFTQESVPHRLKGKIHGLPSKVASGYGKEIVGLYSTNKPKIIKKLTTHGSKLNVVDRHGLIVDMNGIKIANLHLEGGRYSDQLIFKNFNGILKYKLSLLHDIINEKPDVILGDFNSVYSSNIKQHKRFLKGQFDYFSKFVKKDKLTSVEKEKIYKLNNAPYELLVKNGYVYAKPDNESTTITNGRGNSIIDTIWYKPEKVDVKGTHIINIMSPKDKFSEYKCISDHNPLFCEITLHSPNLEKKSNHGISSKKHVSISSGSKTKKKKSTK
jgi:hypothetical protein